jgi:hypothetical protein
VRSAYVAFTVPHLPEDTGDCRLKGASQRPATLLRSADAAPLDFSRRDLLPGE